MGIVLHQETIPFLRGGLPCHEVPKDPDEKTGAQPGTKDGAIGIHPASILHIFSGDHHLKLGSLIVLTPFVIYIYICVILYVFMYLSEQIQEFEMRESLWKIGNQNCQWVPVLSCKSGINWMSHPPDRAPLSAVHECRAASSHHLKQDSWPDCLNGTAKVWLQTLQLPNEFAVRYLNHPPNQTMTALISDRLPMITYYIHMITTNIHKRNNESGGPFSEAWDELRLWSIVVHHQRVNGAYSAQNERPWRAPLWLSFSRWRLQQSPSLLMESDCTTQGM